MNWLDEYKCIIIIIIAIDLYSALYTVGNKIKGTLPVEEYYTTQHNTSGLDGIRTIQNSKPRPAPQT